MGTINIKSERKEVKVTGKIEVYTLYRRSKLKKFSPVVLGLGDNKLTLLLRYLIYQASQIFAVRLILI